MGLAYVKLASITLIDDEVTQRLSYYVPEGNDLISGWVILVQLNSCILESLWGSSCAEGALLHLGGFTGL